jgi:peptidoglycan/LPS O-acetylase OafA/YrhL
VWAAAAAVFAAAVVMLDLTAPAEGIKAMLLQMGISLLGTLTLLTLVYRLAESRKKNTGKSGILSWLGQYTLEIYVLHFRFARLLGLADRNLTFYSLRGQGWLLASFVLMSVLTAVCIFIIKKIPLLNLLLFGKRKKPNGCPGGKAAA